MFGWQRGTKSTQSRSQNVSEVYSLASDFAYARNPWVLHRIIQVAATRLLVDFQGQPRSLDRARLDRDGWVFSSGVCFYSEATMRGISAEWASLGETPGANLHHPHSNDERDVLGLGPTYTRADVMASFRRRAFELHPDQGGDAKAFDHLVEARMRALARIRR
jgi:hypothetical protein